MISISNHDTIVAIATPIGSGAIGIIRLSGNNAWGIVRPAFQPKKHFDSNERFQEAYTVKSHQLVHGYIFDKENQLLIDEVLVVFMRAPHSYTREDVVEIQSHSGPAVMQKLLKLMIHNGARLAEAGEFTQRAFLMGRIDLSQAEAIAAMITARNENAVFMAAEHLSGKMREFVKAWISIIENVLIQTEGDIEFGDEIETLWEYSFLGDEIVKKVSDPIRLMLDQYENVHVLRDGVRLDIIGRPNVGKSSLLNRLIKKEKAIVTAIPGTTRDLIEESISIRGIPIHLTDTAGLHFSDDPIEVLGIRKTKENLKKTELVLMVIDAGDPFTDEDKDILSLVQDKAVIVVANKTDLLGKEKADQISKAVKAKQVVNVSALTGYGIDKLKDKIGEICLKGTIPNKGNRLVPNIRQKILLEQALEACDNAGEAAKGDLGAAAFACELKRASDALKMIIGERHDRQIIDEVFQRFCIGK